MTTEFLIEGEKYSATVLAPASVGLDLKYADVPPDLVEAVRMMPTDLGMASRSMR